MRDRDDELSQPRKTGGFGRNLDPDSFGRFSETIARTLGTGRFLVIQTVVVAFWISLNIFAVRLRWDPYPFILLNLAFSTQAAYAAPLILLAQNRQDDRDRAQSQEDRDVNARTQADTEYLARELSAVRLTLSDVVTTHDLSTAVDRMGGALDAIVRHIESLDSVPKPANSTPEDPAAPPVTDAT